MNVQEFLKQQQTPFEVIRHPRTYDAQRMAHAVHTTGYEVAKTVLLRIDGGSSYVVAVLAAPKSVDMERTRQALQCNQVELATEAEIAEHCPDCELGALPPFGSKYGMRTLIEQGLLEDEEIVFEGNPITCYAA